jgi:hypothetical protein
MPMHTADTPVALEYTETICPAANTIPVLSITPLELMFTSYSMKSASFGAAGGTLVVRAILQLTAAPLLFTMFTLTTENVSEGTVYNAVYVVAAKSAVPNLPVAMLFVLHCYLCQKVVKRYRKAHNASSKIHFGIYVDCAARCCGNLVIVNEYESSRNAVNVQSSATSTNL